MAEDEGQQIIAQFPRSKVWDETTQQIVDTIRTVIHQQPAPTISQIQKDSLKSRPLGSAFHVVQDSLPAPPEDEARRVFFQAIQDLGRIEHPHFPAANIGLEWVSKRQLKGWEGTGTISKARDALDTLSVDVTSKTTIFHIHGGGMFQGSPASYRATTSKLATLTGGRVVSVDYRLCPQHPFPAGLLDVFMTYLSLLYPPPNSAHTALDPSAIVFAGDSSGALFAFGLLQILRTTRSYEPIAFHSHRVSFPIPQPAGITGLSLAGESLQCAPSYDTNRINDLFLNVRWSCPDYPRCGLWPSEPPRASIMGADVANFTHPLLSLCLTPSWEGCPPMWFGSGQEQFFDGAKAVARRAAQQGVSVSWLEFEAMPHCFSMMPGLNRSPQSSLIVERWAAFCVCCVEKPASLPVSPHASRVGFRDMVEEKIPLETLDDPSFEELEYRIKARIAEILREFERDWGRKTTVMAKL